MKTSIVTPWSGNTLDLLPDYERATMGAELILIDNACAPETAQALASLPPERGRVIRNETNLGFAAANNQGYAQATGDVIAFLNSDIAADPSWLKLVADDVKDGYLYGPSLQRQLVYGLWLPYIEGWCIAATRKTWDRLSDATVITGMNILNELIAVDLGHGPWDAWAYPGPYWEENDVCLRAMEEEIGLVQTAWQVQHKGGRTAGPLIRHGASFEANRATFAARVKPVWERMQAK